MVSRGGITASTPKLIIFVFDSFHNIASGSWKSMVSFSSICSLSWIEFYRSASALWFGRESDRKIKMLKRNVRKSVWLLIISNIYLLVRNMYIVSVECYLVQLPGVMKMYFLILLWGRRQSRWWKDAKWSRSSFELPQMVPSALSKHLSDTC